MTGSISWADVQGLFLAASALEDGGHMIRRILTKLVDDAGSLTDPEAFGTEDKGGREFHAKWVVDIGNLTDGIDGWSESVLNTAQGVRVMAQLFDKAEDNAQALAELTGRLVDALTPATHAGGPPGPASGAGGGSAGSGGSGPHGSRR